MIRSSWQQKKPCFCMQNKINILMYFYRENILILFRCFVVVIVLSLIFCCWIDFCRVWLRLIFFSLNMVEILRWINDLAIWIAHVSQILLFPFCICFFLNWWMRASSILFATVTVNFPFIYYTYYMNEWMHNIHRIKLKSKCTSQSLSIPLYFHCHILSDLFLIFFFSFFSFFFIILSDCFNQFP